MENSCWLSRSASALSDAVDSLVPLPSPLSSLPSPLACSARPIDPAKPTSPWLILETDNSRGQTARVGLRRIAKPQGDAAKPRAAPPADYVAHLGANSGGANGVYWVEILGSADGGVLVRNLAGRGKHRIETVEKVIEPDLLYPLLRWGDVARYSATPAAYLLLSQDPATRSGIDESVMRAKYPRTLAYLERFRELLVARAAYRRYQQSGPFYAMYNVGPYTVAPVKVIWRRMDRRINAAVVEGGALPATDSARDVRAGGVRFERRSPLPLCDAQQRGGQRTGGRPQRSRRQGFRHAWHVRFPPVAPLPARRSQARGVG